MRILLTTTRGAGHFGPLFPFAEAFRRAGDEILFATVPAATGMIEAAGFPVVEVDAAPEDERAAVFATAHGLSQDAANTVVVADVFARLDARAAYPGVLNAIEAFRPDLVLHEVAEFAGPLAAERAGVPSARVGIGLAGSMEPISEALFAAVDELRAELGLDADPHGERIASTPYLTLAPPRLDDGAAERTLRFREARADERPLPFWWPGDERPLLYLTFGSVAPQAGFFPGLYRAAIDALAPLPLRILVTVGTHCDPSGLGPLPANVHATRWVPQADVMPHTTVMVCHGGFGTVRAGLAAGVPMVVLPLFAEQPYNARRVADLGAGIALDGGPAATSSLRESVRRVRADPTYRAKAAEIAEDTLALPPVDAAPAALRELLGLM